MSTISIISALVPGQHMWASAGLAKKRYITRRILPPATNFFCVKDCLSWIAQAEYQGQTQARIPELKPLINISFHIRRRLELKYFPFTLHNFCLWLIEQLIDLEKMRTENLKI